MTFPFLSWLRDLGALRWMLLISVIAVMMLAPPPGTPANYDGWSIVRTVLAPVLAPLLMMVLLLDALMCRVFLAEAEEPTRGRLHRLMVVDLIVAIVLVVYWVPYYAALRP